MADLTEYDLEQTDFAVLEQSLLSVPFFVTHRLFIISAVWSASKAIQEKLIALLGRIAPSTVVVLYENKQADGRTKLWQWCKANATLYTHDTPVDGALDICIGKCAAQFGVSVDRDVVRELASVQPVDTWWLYHEIHKLSAYAKSRLLSTIDRSCLDGVGVLGQSISVFTLTDSLRDGKARKAVEALQQIGRDQDPIATAGMVVGLARTVAKCVLTGTHRSKADIAQATGLHPFVVGLTQPIAKRHTPKTLARIYEYAVIFERQVKSGLMPAQTALLLLVVRVATALHPAV